MNFRGPVFTGVHSILKLMAFPGGTVLENSKAHSQPEVPQRERLRGMRGQAGVRVQCSSREPCAAEPAKQASTWSVATVSAVRQDSRLEWLLPAVPVTNPPESPQEQDS